MLVVESRTTVERLTGRQVTDFLLGCDDARYQAWWPGTHLRLHVVSPGPGPDQLGDTLLMDEWVGHRHLRLTGVVEESVPGRRLVIRFRRVVRLPVRLVLDLADTEAGVAIRHRIEAGWAGRIGRWADPLFRLYLTRGFVRAMDDHVHKEFRLLRKRLEQAA